MFPEGLWRSRPRPPWLVVIDKHKREDGKYERWFMIWQNNGKQDFLDDVRNGLSQLVGWNWKGSLYEPSNYSPRRAGQKYAGYVFSAETTKQEVIYLYLDRRWGSEVVRQLKARNRNIRMAVLVDETKGLKTAKYPIDRLMDQIESLGRQNKLVVRK